MRISFGPVAVADPELVGLLGVPGDATHVDAVDLVLERVLPAGADLGDADRAARAVLEAQQDRGDVLGRDRRGSTVSARRSVENVSTGPVGSWRTRR